MPQENSSLKISVEEIESAKTPRGAWTRVTLAKWGVPWPPPAGWRAALIAGEPIPDPKSGKRDAHQGKAEWARRRALDVDPDDLLHKVVMAVVNAGQGHILNEIEELAEYHGSALRTVGDFVGLAHDYEITGGLRLDDRVYRFWCMRPAAAVDRAK